MGVSRAGARRHHPAFALCAARGGARRAGRHRGAAGEVPHLWADPAAMMRWRQRLSTRPELGDARGLKVGLVWAGNPEHKNDRNRSIALERLLPVLEAPGVQWFSLQVGGRAGDLVRLPAGRSRICRRASPIWRKPRRSSPISISCSRSIRRLCIWQARSAVPAG